MPEALRCLPTVTDALQSLAEIEDGSLFLEIFAGEGILTLSAVLTGQLCLQPWDIRFGPDHDVLQHGESIFKLIQANKLGWVHLGTPCQSFTFARSPQLRNWVYLFGCPNLTHRQCVLVKSGNELAAFSIRVAELQLERGRFFSIENPELSWLWILPGVRELRQASKVQFVRCLLRDFGVPFTKPMLFLHNSPFLHELAEGVLQWQGRTITLRGFASWKGVSLFKTHLAQAYTPLCWV